MNNAPLNVLKLTVSCLALMLFFFAYLGPYHSHPWLNAFQDLPLAIGICLMLMLSAINGNSFRIPSCYFWTFVVAYLLFRELIDPNSNPYSHQSTMSYIGFIGVGCLSYLTGFNYPRQHKLNIIFMLILSVAVIQALTGIIQFSGALEKISGINPYFYPSSPFGRVGGNTAQANNYSEIILWGVFSALYLYLNKASQTMVAKILYVIVQGLLLVALCLAQSRTASLGLFVVLVISLFIQSKIKSKIRNHLAIILFVNILLFFSYPEIIRYLTSTHDITDRITSPSYRFEIWLSLLPTILNNPIFGAGPGSIAIANMNNYDPVLNGQIFNHSHNIFIDAAIMFGIPFSGTFITYIFLKIKSFNFRSFGINEFAIFSVFLVFGIHSLLELPHFYGYLTWPIFFIFGILDQNKIDIPTLKISNLFIVVLPSFVVIIGTMVFWINYVSLEKATKSADFAIQTNNIVSVDINFSKLLFPGDFNTLTSISHDVYKPVEKDTLIALRNASYYAPTPLLMTRYILALDSSGLVDQGKREWLRLCSVYGSERCASINKLLKHQHRLPDAASNETTPSRLSH